MTILRRPLPSLFPLLLSSALPAQVAWRSLTVDEALAQAKKDRCIVMVAINMDGERANDEMVADHYKDPRFARLSQHCVALFASLADHGGKCPRAPGVACSVHQAVEQTVRERWLKADDKGYVIAPQHLFLAADGTVLVSVPYALTKGELEWVWVDAIHRVDPEFPWELAPDAHAPRRLEVAGVKAPAADDQRPPSAKEVADILARMNKKFDFREAVANLQILVRSPEEAAQKYVKQVLANAFVPNDNRAALLHQIGRLSPPVWWDEVLPYLAQKDSERVRREAAVALEQLGEKKAAEPLLARFPQETTDAVKGDILSALGRTAGANKKAVALLQEALTRSKPKPWPAELRLQAILAVAALDDRAAAVPLIHAALNDSDAKVRSAALYVIATRRELALLPRLTAGLPDERDTRVQADLAAAVAVLKGGDGKYFADYLKEVAGDTIARDRR